MVSSCSAAGLPWRPMLATCPPRAGCCVAAPSLESGRVDGDELAWPGAEWASCCRGRTRSVNERRDGVRSVRRTTGESGQVPPSPFGVEREAVEAQVPGVAPGQNERNLEDQVGRVDAG